MTITKLEPSKENNMLFQKALIVRDRQFFSIILSFLGNLAITTYLALKRNEKIGFPCYVVNFFCLLLYAIVILF
jgi:hypothetical protein